MKRKHRILGYLSLILLIAIIGLAYFQSSSFEKFSSPEYVRSYLLDLGYFGYLVYIIILLLSILLPIPSTVIVLSGGYVYGTFLGTILSLIGTVLGAILSFYIVRFFGEKALEILVDKHHIIYFNHLFKKYEEKVAIVSYIIPIFPSDVISLLLGLTNMHFLTFILIVFIGNIPRVLLISSLGQDFYIGFSVRTILFIIITIIFLLIAIFRHSVKLLMFKELHLIEKNIGINPAKKNAKKKIKNFAKH